jgi:hypothetical protein
MINILLRPLLQMQNYWCLPPACKAELRCDRMGLPSQDPGIERVIDDNVAWLCRAQDHSASHDGGVARHFSLVTGWSTSYPETTGLIVPTLLAYAKLRRDEAVRRRAKRMLDWLVSLQFPAGGFQGGIIGCKPVVPVTFNTGVILLGLASGVREFGDYREAMRRAADWLVATQDADGCWHKHPTPFAEPGEKAYETYLVCGLLEAARLEPDKPYADAALANLRWALRFQHENGWFDQCCLTDHGQPLTHTLGYILGGLLEAYQFTNDAELLQACRKTADGLLMAMRDDGFLPGRLCSNWRGAVPWACLTGSSQIAHCWLTLYQLTGDARYRDAAYATNRYIRRTIKVEGPPETRGAVKGSFPVSGGYCTYQYINWACKFSIDSNMLEKAVRGV